MLSDLKFSFVNIDQESLSNELAAKVKYYANVIHWTLIYSLPLFWLLDYSFLSTDWLPLFGTRIVLAILCHSIYLYGGMPKNNWDTEVVMSFIVGLNTLFYAIVCSVISMTDVLPYFLMFSVYFLLLNISIFWKPVYSMIQCGVAYFLIIVIFRVVNRYDGYAVLISNGGGLFFVMSSFSCLIGFNRYQLAKREIAKNIMIEMANNRQIDQYQKIADQQKQINEANRKLTKLSQYRYDTLNMMLHDFRNFTGSIQMSLDLLDQTNSNLTEEQKEILGYIGMGNEKLKYLSQKLSASAIEDSEKVDYNFTVIDLSRKVEQTVIDLSDAATMKQVNLQLNIDPSSMSVYLDEIFLDQVLAKLLSSVIRHASTGTIVTVHLHKTDTKAIVDIANKGKLLGHHRLDELFNQIEISKDSATNSYSDHTSAFAVSKRLAEQMGGKLTYNSDENIGNFYRLEFNMYK